MPGLSKRDREFSAIGAAMPREKKMERFNKHFEQVVRYDILYKDRFTNVMQIPKVSKAFLNTGIGKKAVVDGRHVLTALLALEHITGQKPIVTRAKKWVDKFQLKKSMPIGCKLTLRRASLYRFANRLINQVLPLLRLDVDVDVDGGVAEGQKHLIGGSPFSDQA